MTTNDLLELDCRQEENLEIIKQVLKKIEPLNDIEEIPLEKLEKLIRSIKKKYMVDIPWILMCSKDGYYSMQIEIKGSATRYVYGITLYELFGKASILLWSMIKKEKIRKR